ncbi:toprim domain-containing protein [Flavobacterium sp. W1B]|uniref:toprim domain-containing protein n=1 Tax=Flavobacterium sp. W1B TaxID=3394146 RepID=UPI0039BD065E
MNIEQAKQIPIEVILKSMGVEIERETGNDIWYKSPFSPTEKNASFHLSKQNAGYWYCFSSAIGGCNGLDLVVKVKSCTVGVALKYLQSFDSFSFQKQIPVAYEIKKIEKNNAVIKVKTIEHIALKQYLAARGITKANALIQIKEIEYAIKGKKYFAIGFKNRSDSWELRSSYAKICIGKKDITLINNGSSILKITEGFFDFLSLLQLNDDRTENDSDYLILNSAALLLKNISILENYQTIELYLDNDETGEKYTNLILQKFKNATDCRGSYAAFKDLNEFAMWYINNS